MSRNLPACSRPGSWGARRAAPSRHWPVCVASLRAGGEGGDAKPADKARQASTCLPCRTARPGLRADRCSRPLAPRPSKAAGVSGSPPPTPHSATLPGPSATGPLPEIRKGAADADQLPALIDAGDAVTIEVFDRARGRGRKHRAGPAPVRAADRDAPGQFLRRTSPSCRRWRSPTWAWVMQESCASRSSTSRSSEPSCRPAAGRWGRSRRLDEARPPDADRQRGRKAPGRGSAGRVPGLPRAVAPELLGIRARADGRRPATAADWQGKVVSCWRLPGPGCRHFRATSAIDCFGSTSTARTRRVTRPRTAEVGRGSSTARRLAAERRARIRRAHGRACALACSR